MSQKLSLQVDQFIENIMKIFNFAGLAVGIILDKQLVYAKGFGVQNIETKAPLTPNSLFSIASISKTFVATAIMQLVEQGKITLDMPLTAYLPYFHLADPRHTQITIGQMLSHISGMPDIMDYTLDKPEFDDGALERYVRSLGKESLEFDPGEKFVYSNMAYDILGQVIAEISGQLFEDYMEEHILQPLEMHHSTFLYKKASPGLITSPYLNLPELEPSPLYPYTRSHAPCGSLHSNVMDLSQWAIANLNKGKYKNEQIITPSGHDLMWSPVAITGDDGLYYQVGLCWFLATYKGEKVVSHSGSDIGFTTYLILLPEKSAGLVVLANTYPAPVVSISYALLDIILGYEPCLPKPPIIHTLSPILKDHGLSAAVEAIHKLSESQASQYDLSPKQFSDIGYILTDLRRQTEAIEVLRLGIEINPKDDRLYYELARATMQCGDKVRQRNVASNA